jgi:PhnB protein
MALDIFINFEGNCKQAVLFYAEAFRKDIPEFMTFADNPGDDYFPPTKETEDLIMYTSLNFDGVNIMFSDIPPGTGLIVGNNVSLTVVNEDMEEVKRLFNAMAAEGTVIMPLQETFWSKCYGYLSDKFGVHWQFSHSGSK